jgi:hypothetical protein
VTTDAANVTATKQLKKSIGFVFIEFGVLKIRHRRAAKVASTDRTRL